MSKTKYTITETTITDEQGRKIKTYGLKCNNQSVMSDISCNKQIVQSLIDRIDNQELDIQQLIYIIEDSII